jgi:hypothetical protein
MRVIAYERKGTISNAGVTCSIARYTSRASCPWCGATILNPNEGSEHAKRPFYRNLIRNTSPSPSPDRRDEPQNEKHEPSPHTPMNMNTNQTQTHATQARKRPFHSKKQKWRATIFMSHYPPIKRADQTDCVQSTTGPIKKETK